MNSAQNINPKDSLNLAILKDWFNPSSINYASYFCQSTLHQWARMVTSTAFAAYTLPGCQEWVAFVANNPHPKPTDESELSARLHCLYGPCIQPNYCARPPVQWHFPRLAACARSRVYDTRPYHREGKRGPFFEKRGLRRVDWEMAQALMCILTHTIQRAITTDQFPVDQFHPTFGDSWTLPFAGARRRGCTDMDRALLDETGIPGEDPYGISGIWRTLSAELPYTQILVNYCEASQALPPTQTGPPLHIREQHRVGYMQLHVTKIQPPQSGSTGLSTVHMAGHWAIIDEDTGILRKLMLQ
ncbi:MAG: hypothetical protein Q9226_007119, partial [Calogaya cf. arnoldii]